MDTRGYNIKDSQTYQDSQIVMNTETKNELATKLMAIEGIARSIQKGYSGHNQLITDMQRIEILIDESMNILKGE